MEIKEYNSADEIADNLERSVSDTKSVLGEYLRRLDDIRSLAEKSKKIREVIMKLAGKKDFTKSLGELTIGNLSVILDANPLDELSAIEEVVRSHQERLVMLQKTSEALEWIDQLGDTDGLKYFVLENDGVPERIFFRIT